VGLIGLFLRVIFVLATPDIGAPTSMDSGTYHGVAVNLIEGRGYSEDGVNPSIFVAPMYPFFLAAIYSLFGVSPLAAELLQCLLATASGFILYYFGRDLFGRIPAFIGYLMVLLVPELLVLTTFLYTETLFIFLFLCSVWLTWRAIQNPTKFGVMAAGVVTGLTTLTRGVTMFFPLLFLMALLFRHRLGPALRWTLLYGTLFIIPILPWTLRNYVTFHAVVPIAVGTGDVFWTGNYLPLDGKYSYDKTMALMDSMTTGMDQVTRDRRLTAEAFSNIKGQPVATAGLMLRKLYRFWFWIYESAPTGYKRQGGSMVQVVLAMAYYPLLCLFVAGLVLSRGKWRELLFIYLVIVYYVALHVVMLVVPRYRFPILPLMVLFASLAVWQLLQKWPGREKG
jgi:4-amino-4-deoxy-L-arabinose transferase-like glycosyltransferase